MRARAERLEHKKTHLRLDTMIYWTFRWTHLPKILRKHTVRIYLQCYMPCIQVVSLLGRMAIKHHPDKNPDDPHAEERFKEIAIAYQTLSDPTLRKKYNEFGPKESAPEGGFVDPEELFGAIFGGEKFVPIIGHISLGKDMKTALQEAEEAEGNEDKVQRDAKGREILSDEEKAKRNEKEKKAAAEVCLLKLCEGCA